MSFSSTPTYAELATAVSDWMRRTDLTSYVNDLILMGESRINREVKARQMEQRVSATPTTKYVSLPSDFLSMRGVRVQGDTKGWRDYITPDHYFQMFASSESDSTAKVYTVFGDELIFPSTPTGDVELWYYKKLSALSGTSNTLFTANPDLYLFAALAETVVFIKNDARVALWEAKYTNIKNQVNGVHSMGRFPPGIATKLG
jgi:hypothetical protein